MLIGAQVLWLHDESSATSMSPSIFDHACSLILLYLISLLLQNKLSQQDQLTKQLRKKQKDLKENAGAMTNQKTNFSVRIKV